MADSWNSSWGTSWGDSWGTTGGVATNPYVNFPTTNLNSGGSTVAINTANGSVTIYYGTSYHLIKNLKTLYVIDNNIHVINNETRYSNGTNYFTI